MHDLALLLAVEELVRDAQAFPAIFLSQSLCFEDHVTTKKEFVIFEIRLPQAESLPWRNSDGYPIFSSSHQAEAFEGLECLIDRRVCLDT